MTAWSFTQNRKRFTQNMVTDCIQHYPWDRQKG